MKHSIKVSVISGEMLEDILVEICQIFEEDIKNIKARSRKPALVKLRHLYFYVACRVLKGRVPLRLIGEFAGSYDHTTVLNGREVVKGYIENKDPWFYNLWLEYQEKSSVWKSYLAA